MNAIAATGQLEAFFPSAEGMSEGPDFFVT